MARYRTCIDCGATCTGTRCPHHQRARNNSTARGYGADHQRQRNELEHTLPAYCWAGCGKWLEPDGNWVAAHVVDGRHDLPRVATCRSCNEAMKREG